MRLSRSQPTFEAPRGGFTLAEATAAGFLFLLILTSVAQVLVWVASERRAFERRRLAAIEAMNLLERATSLPWEEIDAETLEKLWKDCEARGILPRARFSAEIVRETVESIDTKKIALTVRWIGPAGANERPIRLVTWVHRPRRNS